MKKIFTVCADLDKGGTRRIETYHKLSQILLLISLIFSVLLAVVFLCVGVANEEYVVGLVSFFTLLLVGALTYFFGTLTVNISCGLFYDVRRIRIAQEKTQASLSGSSFGSDAPVMPHGGQPYTRPSCGKPVVYGTSVCKNCGQQFRWDAVK